MSIDWTKSYASTWRVMKVNEITWADGEMLNGVDSISISRDCTDDVPLLETASFEVSREVGASLPFGFYRVEMIARQNGSENLEVLGTFLLQKTNKTTDKNRDVLSVNGQSVLWPASKIYMDDGEFASMGMDGADFCIKLLRRTLPFGISIMSEGSFILDGYIVFDHSSTVLDAVWQILDSAGWCIKLDGYGNITIRPKPTTASLILDQAHACILFPEISESNDLSDIPNVYKVIDDYRTVEVVNDLLSSEVSTTRRLGIRVEEIDDSPSLMNGESIESYAKRQLENLSTIVVQKEYEREYWPDVRPFDIVTGSIEGAGLVGDMRVLAQSLSCGKGIKISETAGRETVLWEGE